MNTFQDLFTTCGLFCENWNREKISVISVKIVKKNICIHIEINVFAVFFLLQIMKVIYQETDVSYLLLHASDIKALEFSCSLTFWSKCLRMNHSVY